MYSNFCLTVGMLLPVGAREASTTTSPFCTAARTSGYLFLQQKMLKSFVL